MREPDICARRHSGNANSFLANLNVAGYKPNQRERLYLSLLNDSRATCEELSIRLGIRYSSCSARLAELKAMRWITESGERRKTSGDEWASVMRALSVDEREMLLHPQRRYTGRQAELFSGTTHLNPL